MKCSFTMILLIFGIVINAQQITQITSHSANDWDPHWSPDGNYFCFTSNRSGPQEIWKILATGDSAVQLV